MINTKKKGGERNVNANKIKGRIVEIFGSQREFAKAIGISEVTVAKKLNNKSEFSQNDIVEWCNALQISSDDVGSYFFANELQKH